MFNFHKKRSEKFDLISGVFFFLGFVASQLQYLSIAPIAVIANPATLVCYAIGYSLWLYASQWYMHYPRAKKHWYGFIAVKNQYKISAALGIAAIICCGIGMLMPLTLILARWFFFASSVLRCIAEYHKIQNPPPTKPTYSQESQLSYLRYVLITALMSFIPAATATISLFFPAATLLACIIATTIGMWLGTSACYYWVDYTVHASHPVVADAIVESPAFISHKLTSQLSPAKKQPELWSKLNTHNADKPGLKHTVELRTSSNLDLTTPDLNIITDQRTKL